MTGATGFIGRSLVPELRRRGHDCTCLVRRTSRADTVDMLREIGCSIAEGDVTDRASLARAMPGHDAVVHLAALVRLGDLPLEEIRRINVRATDHVLGLALENGARRAVHGSSIAALGKTFGRVADESWAHPGFFTSPYERTKHEAQQVALGYAGRGLDVSCALPSVVFGPHDPNFGFVFRAFARGRIKVLPAPETVFSFVHVEDLARGLALVLERGGRGESYILTQANVSLGEFFAHCSEATGVPPPRWRPSARTTRLVLRALWPLLRFTRLRRMLSRDSLRLLGTGLAYSNRKAREQLGWEPGDFAARLRETARYYHEKYGRATGAAKAGEPFYRPRRRGEARP